MLEAAGKNCPDDERTLWQGLDQLMVGITHVRRGNVEGAIALLRRASARPAHYELAAPYAIDVAGLGRYAAALTALKCRHPSLLSAGGSTRPR